MKDFDSHLWIGELESLSKSVGKKNQYRYRGYRYDTETGLYYLIGRVIGPNGETGVRVHINAKGNIHGYPVDPGQYLR